MPAMVLVMAVALLAAACTGAAATCHFDNSSAADRVTLAADGFELQLSRSTGGVLQLLDAAGRTASWGSRGGCLWGMTLADGSYAGSCGYGAPPGLAWNSSSCTLTLHWSPAAAAATAATAQRKQHRRSVPEPRGGGASSAPRCADHNAACRWQALPDAAGAQSSHADPTSAARAAGPCQTPEVEASIQLDPDGSGDALDLRLRLTLAEGCAAAGPGETLLFWPSDLLVQPAAMTDTLIPFLPGLVLGPEYFANVPKTGLSVQPYPGRGMFSDFVAYRSSAAAVGLMLFALPEEAGVLPVNVPPQFVRFGFQPEGNDTVLHRELVLDVGPAKRHVQAHRYRVVVGSFNYSVAATRFRTALGVSQLPSLSQRLGAERFANLSERILLKMDAVQLNVPFQQYPQKFDGVVLPATCHPCGYERNGFDRNYPDMMPPDPRFGSEADFIGAFAALRQSGGHMLVPYTNPTWWAIDSYSVLQLLPAAGLTLANITVLNATAQPRYETYGPNIGVASQSRSAFVQARLADLWHNMTSIVGCDGLFQDQIGARPALIDYSPLAAPAAGTGDAAWGNPYIAGWMEQLSRHGLQAIHMTEQGFDRLAAHEAGFCGSIIGDQYANNTWGPPGVRSTFPFAPMVARQTTLFQQHDLDEATFATTLAIMAFNLKHGYMMSLNLLWQPRQPSWFAAVQVVQRLVAAPLAGADITGFEEAQAGRGDGFSTTVFSAAAPAGVAAGSRVAVNLAADAAQTVQPSLGGGAMRLVAGGGFLAEVAGLDVVVGAVDMWNGQPLTGDWHLLGQAQSPVGTWLYHLNGTAASVAVRVGGACIGKKQASVAICAGMPVAVAGPGICTPVATQPVSPAGLVVVSVADAATIIGQAYRISC